VGAAGKNTGSSSTGQALAKKADADTNSTAGEWPETENRAPPFLTFF
jgi:hypothetical protein